MGTKHRVSKASKICTKDYFKRVIDDNEEGRLWKHFLAGNEENVIAWNAFKRAVEYKRGMPIQPKELSGDDGGPIAVTVDVSAIPRAD